MTSHAGDQDDPMTGQEAGPSLKHAQPDSQAEDSGMNCSPCITVNIANLCFFFFRWYSAKKGSNEPIWIQ